MDLEWLAEYGGTSVYVHLAAGFYVLGLIRRGELWLRFCVLIGTGFYILYYWLHPHEPLWEAIWWSVALGAVNVRVVWQMVTERWRFRHVSSSHVLQDHFPGLSPHKLRQLSSIAKQHYAQDDVVLTKSNQNTAYLYLLLNGEIELKTSTSASQLQPGAMLGEVSYVLQSPALGTAVAKAGATFLAFRNDELAELINGCPEIEREFKTKIMMNAAQKLATAYSHPTAMT